jgi:hypothetical protein
MDLSMTYQRFVVIADNVATAIYYYRLYILHRSVDFSKERPT